MISAVVPAVVRSFAATSRPKTRACTGWPRGTTPIHVAATARAHAQGAGCAIPHDEKSMGLVANPRVFTLKRVRYQIPNTVLKATGGYAHTLLWAVVTAPLFTDVTSQAGCAAPSRTLGVVPPSKEGPEPVERLQSRTPPLHVHAEACRTLRAPERVRCRPPRPRNGPSRVHKARKGPLAGPYPPLLGASDHVGLPHVQRPFEVTPVGAPTVEMRPVGRAQGPPQGVGAAPRGPPVPAQPQRAQVREGPVTPPPLEA